MLINQQKIWKDSGDLKGDYKMNIQETIRGLKNLSMALGVLDKIPQYLIKDAMNNIIPNAVYRLELLQQIEEEQRVPKK